MKNSLWEKEEFGDIVTRAIIGLYDDKNITDIKKQHPLSRASKKDIEWARSIGCYIAPDDRIVNAAVLDIVNDGLPDFASFTEPEENHATEECLRDYISMYFAKKIKKLPGNMKTFGHKAYYELLAWLPQAAGGAYLHKQHFGISGNGVAHMAQAGDMIDTGAEHRFKCSAIIQCTIQFWQDRRHLWNVQAMEHEAKCTFGVYEEQIKSLLYSRNAPLTGTGRLRPILHWVKEHKKRINAGIDVDIKKHLRGVDEFTMGGVSFKITRPLKWN